MILPSCRKGSVVMKIPLCKVGHTSPGVKEELGAAD